MNMRNLTVFRKENIWEGLRRYCRVEITGTILVLFLIGMIATGREIQPFTEEEATAVSCVSGEHSGRIESGIPEEWRTLVDGKGETKAERLWKDSFLDGEAAKDFKADAALSEMISTFPETAASADTLVGFPVPERKTVRKPEQTAVQNPTQRPGEKTEKEDPVPAPVLTFTGSLRMDYCVGSTLELDGITILYGGETVRLSDCEVEGMDTETPGEKTLTVTYRGDTLKIPYGVAEYTVCLDGNGGTIGTKEAALKDYRLDESAVEIPVRLGKEFTGWYRDAEGKEPFERAEEGETELTLYAGWKEFDHYISDERGYLTAYTGSSADLVDGLLRIPAHASCRGIAEHTYDSLSVGVYEVYIPGNIEYIAPGAFDSLCELFYIEVAPDNPNYCSINGVVYTKDGSEVYLYPMGRMLEGY